VFTQISGIKISLLKYDYAEDFQKTLTNKMKNETFSSALHCTKTIMPLFNFIKQLLIRFNRVSWRCVNEYERLCESNLLLQKFKLHPRRIHEDIFLCFNSKQAS